MVVSPTMFGRRLAVIRKAQGFKSMTDFAEVLGIDEERYRSIEGGAEDPRLDELAVIADTTEKSIDFLVTGC